MYETSLCDKPLTHNQYFIRGMLKTETSNSPCRVNNMRPLPFTIDHHDKTISV